MAFSTIQARRPWRLREIPHWQSKQSVQGLEPGAAVRARSSTKIVVAAVSVVVIAGLGIAGWLYYPRKTPALSDKDTIVLADFTNTTGDTVFDDTLRQGVAVQLEQSPFSAHHL